MDNLELLGDEFGYLKTNSPKIFRKSSQPTSPQLTHEEVKEEPEEILPKVESPSSLKPISIELSSAPDKSMVMTPGRQVAGGLLRNNAAAVSGAVSNRNTPAFNQDEAMLAKNLITTIN